MTPEDVNAEDRITAMLTRQVAVLESLIIMLSERGRKPVEKLYARSRHSRAEADLVGTEGVEDTSVLM